FVPSELGFMRTVSWLYVLYHEAGRPSVAFLCGLLHGYDLDPDGRIAAHLALVQQLRTFLQHNLDPGKPHDTQIWTACEEWFQRHCRTRVPVENDHWDGCLLALLDEARRFFQALSGCVRAIEGDEARQDVVDQWVFRKSRYHPPHQFD